jgi:hypothetical protein
MMQRPDEFRTHCGAPSTALARHTELLLATVERFSRLQWLAFCQATSLCDIRERAVFTGLVAQSCEETVSRWVVAALHVVGEVDGESLDGR